MIEEHIEYPDKAEDGMQLSIQVSQVPLNLTRGSSDSLEFLDCISNSLSESFYTSFVNYIDFKWENDRYYQYPIILSNFYFAVCLDYYAIFYAREPESAHLWVAYLGSFAFGLFAFELIQLKVEMPA